MFSMQHDEQIQTKQLSLQEQASKQRKIDKKDELVSPLSPNQGHSIIELVTDIAVPASASSQPSQRQV